MADIKAIGKPVAFGKADERDVLGFISITHILPLMGRGKRTFVPLLP